MRRKILAEKQETPFVDENTSEDMGAISKKVAMTRKTIEALRGLEDKMLSGKDTREVTMMDIAFFADDASELADEVINIANRMKSKVERYIKGL